MPDTTVEGRRAAPRIAVLVPCYNEEVAIGGVVSGFRAALPAATVYVYDNNSSDGTATAARDAGAVVRREVLQGKGHVVRRMFADIDADIYVLVDGDDTYDSSAAPALVGALMADELDMVTATRVTEVRGAYRRGHRFGNRVLTGLVAFAFGNRITDMLSGYRVFSRRFVKSFPAMAGGFETETELTVHALDLGMPIGEMNVSYRERPAGSASKLRTYSDGIKIMRTIVQLVKDERPLQFFSVVALVLLLLGISLGAPVVAQFWETGLVPRLPTAVLATGIVLIATGSAMCGLVLDSITRGRREVKRLAYLAQPAPCYALDAMMRIADATVVQR
jgi:hypothetical protein